MFEMKTIPTAMRQQANQLKLGKLLIVYRDGTAIRCEMEHADDPYVWRQGKWKAMTQRR